MDGQDMFTLESEQQKLASPLYAAKGIACEGGCEISYCRMSDDQRLHHINAFNPNPSEFRLENTLDGFEVW